jgi:integrase/recombinase XerD
MEVLMAAVHSGWALDALVGRFEEHLRRVRGASQQTLPGYVRYVRQFLRAVLGDGPIDVGRIVAPDVIEFIRATTARYRPSTVKLVATSLRSFFRFLRLEGLCDSRLEEAVPTAAHWRLSTIPRHLSEEQLRRLLASLDGATARRCRDRAIVLCLSLLGLRASACAGACAGRRWAALGSLASTTCATPSPCDPFFDGRTRASTSIAR